MIVILITSIFPLISLMINLSTTEWLEFGWSKPTSFSKPNPVSPMAMTASSSKVFQVTWIHIGTCLKIYGSFILHIEGCQWLGVQMREWTWNLKVVTLTRRTLDNSSESNVDVHLNQPPSSANMPVQVVLDPTIQPQLYFPHLPRSQMKYPDRISKIRYSSWNTKNILIKILCNTHWQLEWKKPYT